MSGPQYALVTIEELASQPGNAEGVLNELETFLGEDFLRSIDFAALDKTTTIGAILLADLYDKTVEFILEKYYLDFYTTAGIGIPPTFTNDVIIESLALAYKEYQTKGYSKAVQNISTVANRRNFRKRVTVNKNIDLNIYLSINSGDFKFSRTEVLNFYNNKGIVTLNFNKSDRPQDIRVSPVISRNFKTYTNLSSNFNHELPYTLSSPTESLDFNIGPGFLPQIRFSGTIIQNGSSGVDLIFAFIDTSNNNAVAAQFANAEYEICFVKNNKKYKIALRNDAFLPFNEYAKVTIPIDDIKSVYNYNINRTQNITFEIKFKRLPKAFNRQVLKCLWQTGGNTSATFTENEDASGGKITLTNPWLPNNIDESKLVVVNESILTSIKDKKELYFLDIKQHDKQQNIIRELGRFYINPVSADANTLQSVIQPGILSSFDENSNVVTIKYEKFSSLPGVSNFANSTFYFKLGSYPLSQYYYHKLNDIPYYTLGTKLYNPLTFEHPFTIETKTHTAIQDFQFLFDYAAYNQTYSFNGFVIKNEETTAEAVVATGETTLLVGIDAEPSYFIDLDNIDIPAGGIPLLRYTKFNFVASSNIKTAILSIDANCLITTSDSTLQTRVDNIFNLRIPSRQDSVTFYDWKAGLISTDNNNDKDIVYLSEILQSMKGTKTITYEITIVVEKDSVPETYSETVQVNWPYWGILNGI